ncbi:TlpA family protein disulfide reductase [Marivirga arenosa]|uniref:TlpA disulfide reductase family protein n=1 Tax=Marivirga arenosa TaxID=3059076 RepID=A0AA49GE38_9BACT|nr:TlpA disulfide reductase family protein [Marivirga sp. BKB1-2]WKK81450.2 TlpA disulfide reductase family protein [Marivirga sp. BKB1-2]
MNSYITLLFFFISISLGFSQEQVNLTIRSNKGLSKEYLLILQNETYAFSPDQKEYVFSLTVSEPEFGALITPNNRSYTFWYDGGEVEVFFEQNIFSKELIVSGSESHKIFEKFDYKDPYPKFKEVFISNLNSIVALNYIDRYYRFMDFTKAQFKELYQLIPIARRSEIPNFNAYINSLEKRKIELKAEIIDFTGFDKEGNSISTKDFRGQYLLIDIAASWCGPCWKAFPYLIEVKEEFSEVQFITLNEDSAIDRWTSLAEKNNLSINWPVIWTIEGDKKELLLQYKIQSYPTYLLVDPKGIIVERWEISSQEVLKAKLKKHINRGS